LKKNISKIYYRPNWDKVCKYYFKKSDIDIDNFYGDVLYVGMGSAYGPRKQSNKVNSTTIIEKNQEIIKAFNIPEKKWKIIEADAYDIDLNKNKYDFIFIDIFLYKIPKSKYNFLLNKYSKYLKKEGKIFFAKSIPLDENN
tara:strand:+ start:363 stop:785 length:423 start_codon:yes stop_codon:yes gene_type:complete